MSILVLLSMPSTLVLSWSKYNQTGAYIEQVGAIAPQLVNNRTDTRKQANAAYLLLLAIARHRPLSPSLLPRANSHLVLHGFSIDRF